METSGFRPPGPSQCICSPFCLMVSSGEKRSTITDVHFVLRDGETLCGRCQGVSNWHKEQTRDPGKTKRGPPATAADYTSDMRAINTKPNDNAAKPCLSYGAVLKTLLRVPLSARTRREQQRSRPTPLCWRTLSLFTIKRTDHSTALSLLPSILQSLTTSSVILRSHLQHQFLPETLCLSAPLGSLIFTIRELPASLSRSLGISSNFDCLLTSFAVASLVSLISNSRRPASVTAQSTDNQHRIFRSPSKLNMCHNNSVDLICGTPVATYVARAQGKGKPTVYVCDGIRGMIILTLLEKLEGMTSLISIHDETPGISNKITNNKDLFWPLVRKCNLNFATADKTDAWKRIILPAFRARIKWVERKTVQYGAIIKMPTEWHRGYEFDNAVEAGQWLADCMKEAAPEPVTFAGPATPATPSMISDATSAMPATPTPSRTHSLEDQLFVGMGKLNISNELSDHQAKSIAVSNQAHIRSASSLLEVIDERPKTLQRLNIHGEPMTNPSVSPKACPSEKQIDLSIREWNDGYHENGAGDPASADVLRQLDFLGRERAELLKRLAGLDERRHKLTASL
ncbi:hypothetical protein G7046_g6907 [Stylonectria norvegica]|nr:hypothetical protein G7046_g6907 [Stylonectria norvegica]